MAAAAFLALVAVTACGGGTPASNTAKLTRTSLTVLVANLPSQLDPLRFVAADSSYGTQLAEAAYAGLLNHDPKKGINGPFTASDLIPELAVSVTLSSDQKSYRVVLRQGVKSVAGNPLTSADVQYTFQRVIGSKTTNVNDLKAANVDLKNPVTIIDDHTLDINLTQPSALLTDVMATGTLVIIDSKEAQAHATSDDPWANKWIATHTVGFGAYMVQTFVPNQTLTFVANPNYWRGAPQIKTWTYKSISDPSTRAQAVIAGDADIADQVGIADIAAAKAAADKVGVFFVQRPIDVQMVMNETDPKMANPLVRRAIALALNRKDLAATFQGYGKEALDCMDSNLPHPAPDALLSDQPDITQAKALLAQAGFPNGFSMHIAGTTTAVVTWDAISRILQADLQAVGIQVTIDDYATFAQFAAARYSKESFVTQQSSQIADGAYYLNTFYGSKSGGNLGKYHSATMDGYITAALNNPPGSTAHDTAVQQGCTLAITEQPMVRLAEPPTPEVVSKDLMPWMRNETHGWQRFYFFGEA
ncbi:MAG TPA: ABC transporter substrate-binding protein [Candidatus Micrarchaeaceae archaeon]|nr:ABC transporter substrate-binding protein [Candidatus Micrarchaeaceae archaeon]